MVTATPAPHTKKKTHVAFLLEEKMYCIGYVFTSLYIVCFLCNRNMMKEKHRFLRDKTPLLFIMMTPVPPTNKPYQVPLASLQTVPNSMFFYKEMLDFTKAMEVNSTMAIMYVWCVCCLKVLAKLCVFILQSPCPCEVVFLFQIQGLLSWCHLLNG